ncbi:uncharacterized protein LOC142981555 [Anticarsia gemmatalis]|uniref:uncharacterized protein LOC142981555 n=1 Tax=Anticarsia gemmatalis TaxID=129554 RepID=UPI003F761E60
MIKAVCSLAIILAAVSSQFSQTAAPVSPCPDVFLYETGQKQEPGKWHGVINLSTDITLYGLWLKIALDSRAEILGNWLGEVSTDDHINFKIQNADIVISPGQPKTLKFFVQYKQNVAPKLKTILFNGQQICHAAEEQFVEQYNAPADNYGANTRVEQTTVRPATVVQAWPLAANYQQEYVDNKQVLTERYPQGVFGTTTHSQPQKWTEINAGNGQQTAVQLNPYIHTPYTQQRIQGNGWNHEPVTTQRPRTTTRAGPKQIAPLPISMRPQVYQQPQSDEDYGEIHSGFIDPSKIPGSNQWNTESSFRPAQPLAIENLNDKNVIRIEEKKLFIGGLPSSSLPAPFTSKVVPEVPCGKVVIEPPDHLAAGATTYEGQWPWQAAIYQQQNANFKYICGGTLVSHRHVVTAAHCVTRRGSERTVRKNTLTVYLGKHNLRTSVDGVQSSAVSDIIVHPEYNAENFRRDLAILELQDPASYTNWVRHVCLWPENDIDRANMVGQKGPVPSWGFHSTGEAKQELTHMDMMVVDQDVCVRSYVAFYEKYTSDETYCAMYRDGTRECNSDSGNGMVFSKDETWYLRGLSAVSVPRKNKFFCDPKHYVVFTDIAKFLPWVKDVIKTTK